MTVTLVVNGNAFSYPQPRDTDWGAEATGWAVAVTAGMLQKSGGLFSLLAEVDFGPSFGLKSLYYKSRTANVASAGQVRLARTDEVSFRNEANNADLPLGVNSSNQLTFNGVAVEAGSLLTFSDTATVDLTRSVNTITADIVALSITNALISASAAITRSKLATGTASRVVVNDGSGNLSDSSTTTTQLGFLDATSSIQTQIDSKLNLSGGTMSGSINLGSNDLTSVASITATTGTITNLGGTNATYTNVLAGSSITVSGVPVMHQGVNAITTSGVGSARNTVNLLGAGGANVGISGNTITITAPQALAFGLTAIVQDTNPHLGGTLDGDNFSIIDVSTLDADNITAQVIDGVGLISNAGTISAVSGTFSSSLTVSGVPVEISPDVDKIFQQSAGTVSSINIPLDTNYTSYDIFLRDVVALTDNVNFLMRVSVDGGGTFLSGAADYVYANNCPHLNGFANNVSHGGTGAAQIALISTTSNERMGTATGERANIRMTVHNRGSITLVPMFSWLGDYLDNSANTRAIQGFAQFSTIASGSLTNLQFYMSTGNINCSDVKVFGYK